MHKRILVVVILLGLLLSACGPDIAEGSGNVIVEERKVGNFTKISLSGYGEVIITQGTQESVAVEIDDNLTKYVKTQVKNGTLQLGLTNNVGLTPGETGKTFLNPTEMVVFHVTAIKVTEIQIAAVGTITVPELNADQLKLVAMGPGNIVVESLTANDLTVVLSGEGNAQVAGKVQRQFVENRGTGNYTAPDLESQSAYVSLMSLGGAVVWALETLNARIAYEGNVEFYGDPIITLDITGAGQVISLGEKDG